MKKKIKINWPPGFKPGTSRSAVESSLIKNVNKFPYPDFLSHVGFNLVYRLKWSMNGLFTIRPMVLTHSKQLWQKVRSSPSFWLLITRLLGFLRSACKQHYSHWINWGPRFLHVSTLQFFPCFSKKAYS